MLLVVLLVLPIAFGVSNLDIPLPTVLDQSYGTFELNQPISLVQTCTNLTDFCDSCKITSIKYPDGSIIIAPVNMQKTESLFNYTLSGAFIIKTGKYTVTGHCIGGGVYSPWAYNFEITESGENEDVLDTTSGLVVFLFIMGITYMIFMLPSLIRFTKSKVVNDLLRHLFYLLGSFFLMMDITIVTHIAEITNLGISNELFMFLDILSYFIYPFAIFLLVSFLLNLINAWKLKKDKDRVGFSEEDEENE